MKLLTSFLTFIITAIIIYSCGGVTDPEPIPGRRDYTWEADTLKVPGTYLFKMWGSSPTDVWAVGPGAGLDQTIWHYNGTEWKTDGISRGINPECIWGFAYNNIWICGAEGRIWHFDGTNWSENLWYRNSDFTSVYFVDIWGVSPNDLYAVGFTDSSDVRIGLMLHHNGAEWNRVDIGFTEGILKEVRKGNNTGTKRR